MFAQVDFLGGRVDADGAVHVGSDVLQHAGDHRTGTASGCGVENSWDPSQGSTSQRERNGVVGCHVTFVALVFFVARGMTPTGAPAREGPVARTACVWAQLGEVDAEDLFLRRILHRLRGTCQFARHWVWICAQSCRRTGLERVITCFEEPCW